MDARTAARTLDVAVDTVYAYVSRGLLRSEAVAGSRARRYRASEVRALARRKDVRRDPAGAARGALGWRGLPVLESALTLIEGGTLRYRGRDVRVLSRTASFEDVAALLWDGPCVPARPPGVRTRSLRAAVRGLPLPEALAVALARAGAADPGALDLRPDAVRRTGGRILALLAAVVADRPPAAAPVAATLADGWGLGGRDAEAVERALVFCADHELNSSAFTARCAASAGAPPHACLRAALAALQGRKHGGHTHRVEALFDEVLGGRAATEALRARLADGIGPPGFGHMLYPDGDPRGEALLALARRVRPRAASHAAARALRRAGRRVLALAPNLDFGLTALARALGLPRGAPFALFAVGRSAGWIAHVLEEYAADRLIRPRARYVGPLDPPAPASPSRGGGG